MNFFSPVEALSSSVERGVAKLSQRAFEGAKRDLSPQEPSLRQVTAKAIIDDGATPDQVEEALDFGLAIRDDKGEMKLTPLGQIVLSGYPDDRVEPETARA